MAESSVSSLPSLPEEVIHYGILPRLPAKALMRLQCVSRDWRLLISGDPDFALLQSRLGGASPCALLMALEEPPPRFLCRDHSSAGFPPLAPQFHGGGGDAPYIVASCAGILLVVCNRHCPRTEKLYIGNPVLRVWAPVPLHDGRVALLESQTGLAVYEADGEVRYVLVDPFLKDGAGDVHGEHVEAVFWVFSSATGLWALSEESVVLSEWEPYLRSRACVGGRLYWWGGVEVVWFDVREASSGALPAPPDLGEWRKSRMGEWDGKLSFMVPSSRDVAVWWWSWDEESWLWMCAIELPLICILHPRVPSVVGLAAGFVVAYLWNGLLFSFDVVTDPVQMHDEDYRLFFSAGLPYANTLLRLSAVPAVE